MYEYNGRKYNDGYEYADGVLIRYFGNWPFHTHIRYDCPNFSGVHTIGDGCFAGLDFTEITLPNGIRTIGANAFAHCESLEKIILPDTLEEIGDMAFAGCKSLRSIVIPDSVRKIGARAFAFCGLESIVFPSSVESLGRETLLGCGLLTKAVLPPAKLIPEGVFMYCKELSTVIIPNGVEELGAYLFCECPALTLTGAVAIPPSVTEMGLAFSHNDVDTFSIYAEPNSYAYAEAESMGVLRYGIRFEDDGVTWHFLQ